MKALIEAELFKQIHYDRTHISRNRAARKTHDELVIRSASKDDNGRLERLALLDSAPVPHGAVLVAEREGMLVAAVPVGGGRAIADPFVPSKDIVSLLKLRANQLRAAA